MQHNALHCTTMLSTAYKTFVTLQRIATYCNTLRHTATHYDTLQNTATNCKTLQHTATHCNTLQHPATHCNILQHTATHCNKLQLMNRSVITCVPTSVTLQHTATRCITLQHAAKYYNTLQHTATHCNALQRTTTPVYHCTLTWVPDVWTCRTGSLRKLIVTDGSSPPTNRASNSPDSHMDASRLTYEWVACERVLCQRVTCEKAIREWVTQLIMTNGSLPPTNHTSNSYDSRMNGSCLTYAWVMSHIWMSHWTHRDRPLFTTHELYFEFIWLTYEGVMSYSWISHVLHMNGSSLTYEWVTSHLYIYLSHVSSPTKCTSNSSDSRMNESCLTYE